MWLLFALSTGVFAQDMEVRSLAEAWRPEPLWETRYRRARSTAHVGLAVGAAGAAVTVTGGFWLVTSAMFNDPDGAAIGGTVMTVGLGGMAAGPMIVAGGAMRARRALREQGLHVPPTLGWIAWGALPVAALAVALPYEIDPDGQIGLLGFVGFYGASVASGMLLLDRERHALHEAGAFVDNRDVDVWTAPLVSRDLRGVSLGATF